MQFGSDQEIIETDERFYKMERGKRFQKDYWTPLPKNPGRESRGSDVMMVGFFSYASIPICQGQDTK